MINKILRLITDYYFEILITFCLFSNLYSYIFPTFLYYIGLGLIVYKMTKFNVSFVPKNVIYIFFIAIICLSSILNFALDPRIILFTTIITVTSPFFTSIRWHLYKKKLMKIILKGFACTVVISLIAKILGINYQVMIRMGGVSMTEYGGVDEFSGFARFPMWNSAAAAISTIYFAYLLFKDNKFTSKYRWVYLIMFLASIYICIISASRSAFTLSILCSGLLFYWFSFNIKAFTKYLMIFSFLGVLLLPFFMDSATRMIQKQKGQKETGVTSRDELWAKRTKEFNSSPLYGVGFAVSGVGINRKIGRDESGSSWFAILAQTGIIGFVIAIIIWLKSFTSVKRINYNDEYVLIFSLAFFFTAHSIFEGYMFQGGWYMCLICWMNMGLLNEAQLYRRRLIKINKYLNEKK